MVKEKGNQCYIFRKNTKRDPISGVIEDNELTIQGTDLDTVRKHVDELWNK